MVVATLGAIVILSAMHVLRDLNTREELLVGRAETMARQLAAVAAPAVRSGNQQEVASAVTAVVQDDDVVQVRIVNAKGSSLYSLIPRRDVVDLLVVTAPVGPATNSWGTVELGVSRAQTMSGLLQTVGVDVLLGVVLLAISLAAGYFASAPVRNALTELNQYVQRVAKGESRGERLESELAEIDQVGRTLNEVVMRVEDGQARLAKAQKELKAAQKEMDEYTYVISHDLKEPLRGIEAFSKFLSDGYREKLDDNGRHYVDTIRNSTLRMQRLIGDLLKFSRLAQQRNPMTPVGLNAMLMHVRVNLQFALDQKKAELHVNRLPTVICDATAMTEVFHNLISNAIKYNDKPLPVVEVGCAEKPNPDTGLIEYEFYVRDNGQGIKKEYFDKIFQIFQRLQRDEEGTGIGLTIVRRVIEWHGGRIWLESEEGQGTTFYFTIPKRETTKSGTIMELPRSVAKQGGPVAQTV
ncbi:MAG: Adaptive-response sensory-kinase SasA [Verrucomicrobiae bacterium]|nr:Adaptive-response sensory-kinase SasA [Verrucomicrobiae bacterium]